MTGVCPRCERPYGLGAGECRTFLPQPARGDAETTCAITGFGLLSRVGPLAPTPRGRDVRSKTCGWAPAAEGSTLYETDCGERFELVEGSPTTNYMKYCCYCGKELRDG